MQGHKRRIGAAGRFREHDQHPAQMDRAGESKAEPRGSERCAGLWNVPARRSAGLRAVAAIACVYRRGDRRRVFLGRMRMEKRTLGNTGMAVTVLGYGGAEIGFQDVPADTVGRLINSALDAGLNVIERAECYIDRDRKSV